MILMGKYGKLRRAAVGLVLSTIAITAILGCAAGPEPAEPSIEFAVDPVTHISPGSSPGEKDSLDVRILYNWGRGTRIQGYDFQIINEEGETVRAFEHEETEGTSGLAVPERIIWKGRDDEGRLVPEGRYGYFLEVLTYRENIILTDYYTVVVDNTPPRVSVEVPYTVFSPNDDGNQDLMVFEQTGSDEPLWSAEIRGPDGGTVETVEWTDSPPQNFHWNGLTPDGTPYPDGEYAYVISAKDPAGNRTEERVAPIRLSTLETTVTVTRRYSTFSPNADGNKDTQTVNLEVPVTEGIESWTVTLTDTAGETVGEFSGSGTPPANLSFPEGGEGLDEGSYVVRAGLVYRNGNRPTDTSNTFTVDLTPPSAEAEANYDIFSPNGDGNKEAVTITQSASEEDTWFGRVFGPGGDIVREYTWRGFPEEEVSWEGVNQAGEELPDGVYTYRLVATDDAGNTGSSPPVEFEKDTSEIPELVLKPNYRAFSPNEDGVKESLRFDTDLTETEGIIDFRFTISRVDGPTVSTRTGEAAPPETFVWNGRTDEDEPAENGDYTARLRVRYRNGNAPVVTTGEITLDREPPEVMLQVPYTVLSPNGDGNRDVLPVMIESSNEQEWVLEIRNAEGQAVFDTYWNGRAEDFEWKAVDANGDPVSDGIYDITISTVDEAGNTGSDRIDAVEVDTAPTPVYVKPAAEGFSPDGDGVQDRIDFNLFVDVLDGIEGWSVDVIPAGTDETVRTYGGETGDIPESVSWDGSTDEGEIASEGPYTARLTVRYLKGNVPTALTETAVILDVTDPTIRVSITPDRFSPDGDGRNDVLSIDFKAIDRSEIVSWAVVIRGPRGNRFREFSGDTLPTEAISWDGLSGEGELVQSAEDYPTTITAADRYGNTGSTDVTVTTDILVERENGTLKIRISSIYFEPNTANFRNLERERAERNLQTLDRLAEILQRFDGYEITVEGHATHIFWQDPDRKREEQRETLIPLSRDRAEAIKEALVERGIDPDRMSIEAKGGAEPVVPHGDLENRWKNRRVEFILEREGDEGTE
jgi:outer membrane protein OmpA-like peptidoglycan-associated protein/flagellar hook assembly protein FlgD